MKTKRVAGALGIATMILFATTACGDRTSDSKEVTPDKGTATVSDAAVVSDEAGELTVFAAASLNTAFPEIAAGIFKEAYPNVEVKFSFAGSSSLAEQMNSGAPVDVFASADEKNMGKVVDLVPAPVAFTSNTLRLVVPAGNPAGVKGLDSMGDAKLVVCAPQVPCGRLTTEVSEALGVTLTPVSEEQSVTDVRTKVETGEADAGLVYITDAKLAGDKIEIIEVPGLEDHQTKYMIGVPSAAPSGDVAKAFLDAVMAEAGQEVLAKYGFAPVQ
ncbi:MAG: molybdate ABC transporter substrate-binding protein [Actinomycetaceae bacterium]|nr:molybdate ABC transporter substrate-binding protein [Actinomycetaceae bacterium]